MGYFFNFLEWFSLCSRNLGTENLQVLWSAIVVSMIGKTQLLLCLEMPWRLQYGLFIDGTYMGKWDDPNGSSLFDLYNIGLLQQFVFPHHLLNSLGVTVELLPCDQKVMSTSLGNIQDAKVPRTLRIAGALLHRTCRLSFR